MCQASFRSVSYGRPNLHLSLSSQSTSYNDHTAQNRESGLGALLGYINGIGTGVIYGMLRSQIIKIPTLLAAPLVGLTAMALRV